MILLFINQLQLKLTGGRMQGLLDLWSAAVRRLAVAVAVGVAVASCRHASAFFTLFFLYLGWGASYTCVEIEIAIAFLHIIDTHIKRKTEKNTFHIWTPSFLHTRGICLMTIEGK